MQKEDLKRINATPNLINKYQGARSHEREYQGVKYQGVRLHERGVVSYRDFSLLTISKTGLNERETLCNKKSPTKKKIL